jgi:hypothetical protein
MGNWIYTSEIDKKLENQRIGCQDAAKELIGTTFNEVNATVHALDKTVTKQVFKIDQLLGNTVSKLDNVARYTVDNVINGLDRSVSTFDKTTRYAVGTLDNRVQFSLKMINDTVKDSVKTIEDSINKIDRRIKETFEAFSNLQQFSLVLCIMLFCVYQYGFQNLETLIQVLVYPSIIGIIIVCFSVIIEREINTLVYTLFFLTVILIQYIYSNINSKFIFKGTLFELGNFYIEISFLSYYTFLYNRKDCYDCYVDYQCIIDPLISQYSIFSEYKENRAENFNVRKLPLYILTYLLSFKYSFKIFEFEYLLTILVVRAFSYYFDFDLDGHHYNYKYLYYLLHSVYVSNHFSVLISIWTWVVTFILTTILPASTSVGNLISLISFSSFLIWFLKYEKCLYNWIVYGMIHFILFPLFFLITLIIKLGL